MIATLRYTAAIRNLARRWPIIGRCRRGCRGGPPEFGYHGVASQIFHNAGTPPITPSATPPLYTQQGFKPAFRVVANDNLVSGALAR
jgi:hypothetical protein